MGVKVARLRLQPGCQSGLFMGALLILGIVSAQMVLLILNGTWWPSINLLMLILTGQLAVYVYLSGQSILDDLLQKQHEAWYALGHYRSSRSSSNSILRRFWSCREGPI